MSESRHYLKNDALSSYRSMHPAIKKNYWKKISLNKKNKKFLKKLVRKKQIYKKDRENKIIQEEIQRRLALIIIISKWGRASDRDILVQCRYEEEILALKNEPAPKQGWAWPHIETIRNDILKRRP